MVINHDIVLDVARSNDRTVIKAKQHDVNSRTVTVSLYNNGEALTVPQDCGVVVNALRPDGQTNGWAGAVLEDGSVLVPLVSWLLGIEGYGTLSVSVISPARERLTSFSFNSYTQKVEWTGEGIEDDPNYDVLLTLISDTEAAKAGAWAAALAAQNAETAANEAAGAANDAADRADTATANAETATANAETATAEAHRAVAATFEMLEASEAYLHEQVDTAVDNAEAATNAATAAAELANTKAALANEKAAAAAEKAALADEKATLAGEKAAAADSAADLANTKAFLANEKATAAQTAADTADTAAALANTKAALADEKATLANTKAAAADAAATAANTAAAAADAARLGIQGDLADANQRMNGIAPRLYATSRDLTDGNTIKHADGTEGSGGGYFGNTGYIEIEGIAKIAYMRPVTTVSSAPTHGMAFYNSSKVYISGVANGYGAAAGTSELITAAVPEGAKYARFTYWASDTANYSAFPFAVYDAADYEHAADLRLDAIENVRTVNIDLASARVDSYIISGTTGKWSNANNAAGFMIPIPTGTKTVTVTAGSVNGTAAAMLADDSHGTYPNYASGGSRVAIAVNTSQTFEIPANCRYLWIMKAYGNPVVDYAPALVVLTRGAVIPFVDPSLETAGDAADAKVTGDQFRKIFPANLYAGAFSSGSINAGNGTVNSSSSTVHTGYVDVSDLASITYTRIVTAASSTSTGMAFYNNSGEYISGEKAKVNGDIFRYELRSIAVPTGAKYARFSWNTTSFGSSAFGVYDTVQYTDTMRALIDDINFVRPYYKGKKVSILGDSISTFVLATDKEQIDGKNYAPTGCTTNFPGNLVQFASSDVQDVFATWWGKLLAHTGMMLGINESYAGSMISWDGTTENYKYGEDKCMASEARIGHLDDNGTPHLIIVFGGTNDINHHAEMSIPLGALDTENDPSDYDNFPMITNTIYGAITTMFLRIQHSYPDAKIVCVLPYFCTETHVNTHPSDVAQVDGALIDVCNYLGVDYVDLRKVINLYDIDKLTFDDLHPNETGMREIAKAVLRKIETIM